MKLKAAFMGLVCCCLTALAYVGCGVAMARAFDEKVVYPVSDIAIFKTNQPNAKAIGLLTVGAKLILLKQQGSKAKIRIEGWYQHGTKRVLYAVQGRRILDLAIKKKAAVSIVEKEASTDPETGLVWHRATLDGWVASNMLTTDAEAIWARADKLFSMKCTACHERRVPGRYTANQWTSNVKAMASRAGLSKKERNLIIKFLQYRSKDMQEHRVN
ncbi:hypothetical protein [Cohaesibacter gelatinilyticus]|uniref:Trimethylamine-N-oxide reductase (Cytochrome c), cytochrome c-type subunit TorC n=1 Tax=Cohaesibacter gelatinilyticus TaxID=372072 RepID=A0A285PJD4_9HYPH|nr:hypothetical protein [Cohaesibacter gelatinilyticus]SNZ21528.1 trimethylamine-N-oxide reductase (cytochrome c), cytochrome c-type subunit TorC [Cohaesibacter gelatinilyticus]